MTKAVRESVTMAGRAERARVARVFTAGVLGYRSGDPRAVVLLGLVRRAAPKSGQLAVAEAVLAEVRRRSPPSRPTQAAVRYVTALSTPARLRSSTHDAAAVCY
jgi:hypothetical protein